MYYVLQLGVCNNYCGLKIMGYQYRLKKSANSRLRSGWRIIFSTGFISWPILFASPPRCAAVIAGSSSDAVLRLDAGLCEAVLQVLFVVVCGSILRGYMVK